MIHKILTETLNISYRYSTTYRYNEDEKLCIFSTLFLIQIHAIYAICIANYDKRRQNDREANIQTVVTAERKKYAAACIGTVYTVRKNKFKY